MFSVKLPTVMICPRYDPELLAITHQFAEDNNLFLQEFSRAWTKLANADRFDGPTRNICSDRQIVFEL